MKKITKKSLHKLHILPKVHLKYEATRMTKERIDDAEKAAKFLRKMFDKDTFDLKEEIVILFFKTDDYPIGAASISKGEKEKVDIDLHYLFQLLYLSGATRFIFSHNHPMASPLPSEPDIFLTHTLTLQCSYLGFELVDHIIVNKKEHYSFAENGLLPVTGYE